ncbi:universal stress protein [Janthinobacterium sp. MDB2-8]|uniref:universal stress protein n=1 Tax=Janthinobacterium sp. MDB2-8 TaxID=1259338 RepID=UPI003F254058
MAYKSILVHADLSRHAPQRIAIAARLAHAHQAHLIGAAMTGMSRFYLENNRGMRGAAAATQISALHRHAQAALDQFTEVNSTVVVAWDGSMEATRAIGHSLPLLRAARLVVLALLHPPTGHAQPARHPGADIAAYLSRHGVPVEVRQTITTGDIGAALLATAAEVHAGLLVMGGYGHARFREILLGGVTETVLRQMTLPVLMAH